MFAKRSLTFCPTLWALLFFLTSLASFPAFAALSLPPPETDKTASPQWIESYGKLPLSFEANRGQTDEQVKFLSRGQGYSLFLTPTEAVLALHKPGKSKASEANKETLFGVSSSTAEKAKANPIDWTEDKEKIETLALRMKLTGANPNPHIAGLDELPGKVNYFTGNDPSKWRSGVSTYAKVRYASVYPGIDLVYYGNQRQLEYDFVVNPGADPNAIRLNFEGADQARVDENGDLVLTTQSGELRLHKPSIYQDIDGQRRPVEGRFVLHTPFSLAGDADSLTPSPLQGIGNDTTPLPPAGMGIYTNPLPLAGGGLGWGSNADDTATLLGFNALLPPSQPSPCQGEGVDFSALSNLCKYPCLQGEGGDGGRTPATCDNPQSSLDFLADRSCNRGKAETATTAILDSIAGFPVEGMDSVRKPVLQVGFQIDSYDRDEPLTIDPVLVYSTYLGGSREDAGLSIAVDGSGNAYVTGYADSSDFATINAKYPHLLGAEDGFVEKLSADGQTILYSTFFGGGGDIDRGLGIAVDGSGNAYVTGTTDSNDFPTVNAKYSHLLGTRDAFVFKLSSDGQTVVYSTYLGGSGYDVGESIAVDRSGNRVVSVDKGMITKIF